MLGAIILFVAANAGLVGASRLSFAMAEHHQLPRLFRRLHPHFKTPYVSLALYAGLAGFIIIIGRRLTFLADLYNFGAMLAFSLAHLSLLGLRVRRPALERPFKVPVSLRVGGAELPVTALFGLVATLAVWVDVVISKPAGRNVGFAWMALGLVCYVGYRRQRGIAATART
jgi:APA family basic amino acid/polyamine antiporter